MTTIEASPVFPHCHGSILLDKNRSSPQLENYGDPNKLDFIYSELAFGQLFFVAYSSCLFLADTFTQK
ncbi:hypothetical protein ODY46_08110, partial [Aerococcus sp. CDC-944-U94]|uniref:hypothetical protein n=1 Tax=Aerococcus urinae (strain CCUG 59500 / ACS-120-V-Col10a) TaxID=2976812 RepID=UPI00227A120D